MGKVVEPADRARLCVHLHAALTIGRIENGVEVASRRADRVEAADEDVVGLLREREAAKGFRVLREQEPVAARDHRDETERLEDRLARLHAQAGEPLELGDARRAHPPEEPPGERAMGIVDRDGSELERARLPERVLETLLVEPAADGHTSDRASRLEEPESDGQ